MIGEVWRVGTAALQVCQPRIPCYKLGLKFGHPLMLKWFAQAARPGAYLRILEEGEIGAGDEVEIRDRPAHGVTIATVNEAMLWENDATAAAPQAPELPPRLAEWLRERATAA